MQEENKTINTFQTLNTINVSGKTEKKNGLTYLSWAWAWGEFKKVFPKSYYTIYENKEGINYFTDGRTCWVKTGVTLVQDSGESLELIEYLPVMDFRNKSIPVDSVTSMDINKTIQRSLTKCVARHGLGLYVYAGEDLPEESEEDKAAKKKYEEDVAATISKIDDIVRTIIPSMSKEEKTEWVSNNVVATVGTQNYRLCKDLNKLNALLKLIS